jgi:hypothetical protein
MCGASLVASMLPRPNELSSAATHSGHFGMSSVSIRPGPTAQTAPRAREVVRFAFVVIPLGLAQRMRSEEQQLRRDSPQ